MTSLLKNALDKAVDQSKQQKDDLLINTMTPQEARAEASARFNANDIENFADLVKSYDLNPNIILENGLTLVQDIILRYPPEPEKLKKILMLGADPNLYMTSNPLESVFGDPSYPKSFHPLNFAFNSYPTISGEICQILREFGATTQDLVARKEKNPALACQDDIEKATLRKTLIDMTPNPVYVENIRQGIDTTDRESFLTQQYPASAPVVEVAPPANDNIPLAHEIGEVAAGLGIYIGLWKPIDNDGRISPKTYHIYCASTNLLNSDDDEILTTYDYAVAHTATLNVGPGGVHTKTDQDLYKLLFNNEYQGEWFIPPVELITGTKQSVPGSFLRSQFYQEHNLYACIDKLAFEDQLPIPKESSFDKFFNIFRTPRSQSFVWTSSYDSTLRLQYAASPRVQQLREFKRSSTLLPTRLFRAVPA